MCYGTLKSKPIIKSMQIHDTISPWFVMINSWLKTDVFLFFFFIAGILLRFKSKSFQMRLFTLLHKMAGSTRFIRMRICVWCKKLELKKVRKVPIFVGNWLYCSATLSVTRLQVVGIFKNVENYSPWRHVRDMWKSSYWHKMEIKLSFIKDNIQQTCLLDCLWFHILDSPDWPLILYYLWIKLTLFILDSSINIS